MDDLESLVLNASLESGVVLGEIIPTYLSYSSLAGVDVQYSLHDGLLAEP